MTSLVFHPHTRRIGYRAKRKPSWKVLREFVHGQLRKEVEIIKQQTKESRI